MNRKEFFLAVAKIIGNEDTYIEPTDYIRRWKRKRSKEGLYPGFGIIRWFNENLICVVLEGSGSKVVLSADAALLIIKKKIENEKT